MNELQLYATIMSILNAGFAALGIDVEVENGYQPTTTGVPSAPTIIFYPLFDKRYGWTHKKSEWNADDEEMVNTTTQVKESTFQITARADYDLTTVDNSLTAADYVEHAADILQSDATIAILVASGMGVLKITDIRKPYVIDDRDKNAFAPSFDVVITHPRIVVTQGVPLYDIQPAIYPI